MIAIIIPFLLLIGLSFLLYKWVKTIQWYEVPTGQQGVIDLFKSTWRKFGRNISYFKEEIKVVKNKKSDDSKEKKEITIKAERNLTPEEQQRVYLLIWPWSIRKIQYRRKRFITKAEAEDRGAFIHWKPPIVKRLETSTKEEDHKLSRDFVVLAEIKEKEKETLLEVELEDIVMSFETEDTITGETKAQMEFIVWDVDRATSKSPNFKDLPEKAASDVFRNWSTKHIYEKFKGFSFREATREVEGNDSNFFDRINAEICEFGVYLRDIHIIDHIPDEQSVKVLESRRNILIQGNNATASQSTATIITNEGNAKNAVAINLEEGLQNVRLRALSQERTIDLTYNDKTLGRLEKHKQTIAPIAEYTPIAIAAQLGKASTLVLNGNPFSGTGSSDKIDESTTRFADTVAANLVTDKTKKEGK